MNSHNLTNFNSMNVCPLELDYSLKWGDATMCSNSRAPNLEDSHSTVHSSLIAHPNQKEKSKFYAFKRLKESKIKQKNDIGAIINREVLRQRSVGNQRRNLKLKTLDDAVTIVSHLSPKSSIGLEKCVVEESIIIMRANNFMEMSSNQPSTPFFRKSNSLKDLKREQSEYFKPFQNKQLIFCVESGMLCHYQIIADSLDLEAMSLLQNMNNTVTLSLFASFPLSHQSKQYSLILFQPYTQSLNQFISRKQRIQLKKIVDIFIQITKTLCYLRDLCIYPILDLQDSVFFSGELLKLKVVPSVGANSNERKMVEECGRFYMNLLRKCESQYLWENRKILNKVIGMNIDKKMKLIDLLNQFMFNSQFSLDEGYVKLQTFQS